MMDGTVPARALVDPMNAPFVIQLLVNSDNAQHTPNENLRTSIGWGWPPEESIESGA